MLYRLLPLALLFVLVLGLRPLGAQERGDMFTVSDVAVDVTAGTAAAAREQAFVDGQRKAFRILLDRLGADATRIHDRKSVVSGKSVPVRVDLGGRSIIQKKKKS